MIKSKLSWSQMYKL